MIKTAHIRSLGGREEQQDSVAWRESGSSLLAIVCDGLGGHAGGARASAAAVEAALESFEANPAVNADAVAAHLETAHVRVQETQKEATHLANMRTTAVALVTDGQHAVWAHAGDSRLYHFRGGRIVSRTRDHSVPERLAEAGEIEASAIRFHEDRNRLLRAVGSVGELRCACSEPIPVEPGDAFLLCTDGFWEWVIEEEMEAARDEDPAAWLAAMERQLVAKATDECDNYTALVVCV